MLENEIRHVAICEEINRAYKQGAGKEFHETFHGFRDRNDAIKMSRSLLGLNLDMFKDEQTSGLQSGPQCVGRIGQPGDDGHH